MGLWNWRRKGPLWSFVIDTSKYAGNFERELAAYVIGRCDHFGEEMERIKPYLEQHRAECGDLFKDLVEFRVMDPGDDGICRTPMDLAPSPGNPIVYNSVALSLKGMPTKKQLAILVKRAKAFPSLTPTSPFFDFSSVRIRGCRLVEERTQIVSHPVTELGLGDRRSLNTPGALMPGALSEKK